MREFNGFRSKKFVVRSFNKSNLGFAESTWQAKCLSDSLLNFLQFQASNWTMTYKTGANE